MYQIQIVLVTALLCMPYVVFGMASETYTIESPRFLPHNTEALTSESYRLSFEETAETGTVPGNVGGDRSTRLTSPSGLFIGAQTVTQNEPVLIDRVGDDAVLLKTPEVAFDDEDIKPTDTEVVIDDENVAVPFSVTQSSRFLVLILFVFLYIFLRQKTMWGRRYLPF